MYSSRGWLKGVGRLITAVPSNGICQSGQCPYRPIQQYSSHFMESRRTLAFNRRSFRGVDDLRNRRLARLRESRVASDVGDKQQMIDSSTVTENTEQQLTWTEWSMRYAAALVIRRQLEPLNIFLGFEQANRYSIEDDQGRPVAYLAEEESKFSSAIARQLLRTHRPFKAVIVDNDGQVILKLHRPWTWINTHIYVMDAQDRLIGQVIQQWHLWRRRYELFIRHDQFAQVDAGFLAWRFELTDEQDKVMACVDRRFGGFAREIFTDTGQYALLFHPDYLTTYEGHTRNEVSTNPLTGDERAVVLACAIGIDFDYFSRHSHGMMGGGGFFPIPFISHGDDTIGVDDG